MSEKNLKEIAKELNLIRRELQRINKPQKIEINAEDFSNMIVDNVEKQRRAKERVAGDGIK